MRATLVAAMTAALLAIAPTAIAAPTSAQPGQSAKLRNALTVQQMREHLTALQGIANLNGGTRAAGTPGYEASVQYVAGKLRDAGYDPVIQRFDFDYFEELTPSTMARTAPTATTYVNETDFHIMDFSGSGDVTATVQAVDINLNQPGPSTSGCEAGDFAGFTAGNIALIQRGTCTFGEKAANAVAAGAVGVVIFNQGNTPERSGVVAGTLGGPVGAVPVLGISYALGQEFATTPGTTLHITTNTLNEVRSAANVLADTPKGDDSKVVLVGSHLDSVAAGPGINDNGSGSAFNLELAEQIAAQNIKPRNTIRFAFWGAEEQNLIGSTYYVDQLSEEEGAKIALNLNFDMLASPNFVRFVYDGDGGGDPDAAGPSGSGTIEQVFLDYFESQDLATEPTPFDGRSDYGPFIAVGIPAGGLFSGAEVGKTPEQAAVYGGVAGQPYDPCYHQACDTINNINDTSLGQLGDAGAHATLVFAMSTAPVTGASSQPGKSTGKGKVQKARKAPKRKPLRRKLAYSGSHLVR